tara:strand:- start:266 stop:895 length:630 start_codon:yes stop_codon:yes gene_type:complete
MSHNRNTKYLDNRRIVYRRNPITDKPTQENEVYMFYENGTHECYHLFNSKAKITTYKSLKWHLLVIWYLNPQLDQEDFMDIAEVIANKEQGFTTFSIHAELLRKMVYEISMLDLDEPPKNKLRKVIFKWNNGMCTEEKLRIVGQLIGRSKKIHPDDIYELMLSLNHSGWKITIKRLAARLNCSTRTIHRNLDVELRREIKLLNQQNEEI